MEPFLLDFSQLRHNITELPLAYYLHFLTMAFDAIMLPVASNCRVLEN